MKNGSVPQPEKFHVDEIFLLRLFCAVLSEWNLRPSKNVFEINSSSLHAGNTFSCDLYKSGLVKLYKAISLLHLISDRYEKKGRAIKKTWPGLRNFSPKRPRLREFQTKNFRPQKRSPGLTTLVSMFRFSQISNKVCYKCNNTILFGNKTRLICSHFLHKIGRSCECDNLVKSEDIKDT